MIADWMDEIKYPLASVITDPEKIKEVLALRADPKVVTELLATFPGRTIEQVKIEQSPPARAIWGSFSTGYAARAYKLS